MKIGRRPEYQDIGEAINLGNWNIAKIAAARAQELADKNTRIIRGEFKLNGLDEEVKGDQLVQPQGREVHVEVSTVSSSWKMLIRKEEEG